MLLRKVKNYLVLVIVPTLFLIVGIATLKDYGVNWDEPFHFMRGQTYLHFFLTGGEKDNRSLPPYPRISLNCFDTSNRCKISPGGPTDREDYNGKNLIYEDVIKLLYPKNASMWRSYYQHDLYTFDEVVKSENGHPAVGDITAALFNFIFYQKLHIFGDIESYHLFEVFTAFLIVLGVSVIVYSEFGPFPAIVSSFSLGAYPLFFSESHFNIKDPPEAAFFGLTIVLFYFGITRNKWTYIIFSSIVAAFAIGTKFNAFFIFPILGLWTIFYLFSMISKNKKIVSRINIKKVAPLLVSLFFYPLVAGAIFYLLWPYLWNNPIENFLNIVKYYKQIGLGTPPEMAKYILHGWNTYPITWIYFTTPIPILLLSIVGFISSLYLILFKRNNFAFLIIIWFAVPILRSSFPNSSIYGGVRQIMEFLPAMAILTGIGAYYLIFWLGKIKYIGLSKFGVVVILISMIYVSYEMVRIHPNENVYFNQLIGGLSGAKAAGIPYWGNSYGNAYQQGIDWLNKNAEPNARLGLLISTMGNIPRIKLRSDIDFANSNWSGPAKLGEYEIELDFDWSPTAWYSFAYYDIFLNPVFVAQVDGVPILKVWKNDIAHTRKRYEKESIAKVSSIKNNDSQITIDLGKEVYLTRLTIFHSAHDCSVQKGGYIAISSDGKNWIREPEPIDYPQVPPAAVGITDNNFVFLFAAKGARYILLDTMMQNSCLFKNPSIEVRKLSS